MLDRRVETDAFQERVEDRPPRDGNRGPSPATTIPSTVRSCRPTTHQVTRAIRTLWGMRE